MAINIEYRNSPPREGYTFKGTDNGWGVWEPIEAKEGLAGAFDVLFGTKNLIYVRGEIKPQPINPDDAFETFIGDVLGGDDKPEPPEEEKPMEEKGNTGLCACKKELMFLFFILIILLFVQLYQKR